MNDASLAEVSFFWSWLWPILLTAAYGAGVYYLIPIVRERLRDSSERDAGPWAELRYHALGWPLIAVLVAVGALLLPVLWPIAWPRQNFLMTLGRVGLIVLAALLTLQMISLLHHRAAKGDWLRVRPLRHAAAGLIYGAAALMVLQEFGFALVPVWIALGGVALGLALAGREALRNLLAGVELKLRHEPRVGEALELEDGTLATVERIGWLRTRARATDGAGLTIPNARLTEELTVNFHRESAGPRVELELGIAPRADLARAEAIALETLYELDHEQPSAGEPYAPSAHYTDLNGQRALLCVSFHVGELGQLAEARGIYLKAVNEALRAAGIGLA